MRALFLEQATPRESKGSGSELTLRGRVKSREITSSITSLAHTLDMIVVAEYVEEEEQKEVLHEIGCNCYQGLLYSKAIPIEK